MGVDRHEERDRNGETDPNPLAQRFANPAAAYRHYSAESGSGEASWRFYKAKAQARKIRRMWYGR